MRISELIDSFHLKPATPPDMDFEIRGVRPLDEAEPGDLSFLANPRYKSQAVASRASAILVQEPVAGASALQLICGDPYLTLAGIMQRLFPEPAYAAGIHPTAVIADDAEIEPDCHIGPHCVIASRCHIGSGSVLIAQVHVGADCRIGKASTIFPMVVLYANTRIGNRVRIHANTVIGSDGFGYAQDRGRHVKVPQIGGVRIGDDVEIGSNVAIDRGSLKDTVIGDGVKVDNLVQIGHGVRLGDHAIIVSQTGVSGSSEIGAHSVLAGQVGVVGHIVIGPGVTVMGKSVVTKDLEGPGQYAGNPAVPHRQYQRQLALSRRLPELVKRIHALEKRASQGDPS